jgi:hypothetical protein
VPLAECSQHSKRKLVYNFANRQAKLPGKVFDPKLKQAPQPVLEVAVILAVVVVIEIVIFIVPESISSTRRRAN